MTRGPRVAVLLAFAGSLASCVPVVPYRPNPDYADRLGRVEAENRFGEVMTRVSTPRVLAARLTDDYYEYEIHVTSRNVHGIPVGVTAREVHRDFTNVDRVVLHVNHVVYVFSKSGQLLDHLRFLDQKDAKVFIDLVISYRDRLKST